MLSAVSQMKFLQLLATEGAGWDLTKYRIKVELTRMVRLSWKDVHGSRALEELGIQYCH